MYQDFSSLLFLAFNFEDFRLLSGLYLYPLFLSYYFAGFFTVLVLVLSCQAFHTGSIINVIRRLSACYLLSFLRNTYLRCTCIVHILESGAVSGYFEPIIQ